MIRTIDLNKGNFFTIAPWRGKKCFKSTYRILYLGRWSGRNDDGRGLGPGRCGEGWRHSQSGWGGACRGELESRAGGITMTMMLILSWQVEKGDEDLLVPYSPSHQACPEDGTTSSPRRTRWSTRTSPRARIMSGKVMSSMMRRKFSLQPPALREQDCRL